MMTKALPQISNGIKNGNFIRVPLRGDEEYHVMLTILITSDDIIDKGVITEIREFKKEGYHDIKLASYKADGWNCSDGQVMILYSSDFKKYTQNHTK